MTRSRAVLLSGSLGLGHEMLVRSCAGLLQQAGWDVRSLDCMALLGRRCGAAGQRLFTKVVGAAPGFYDGLHFAHLRPGSRLASMMDARASARLIPALRSDLSSQPSDLVLSVFATGASAAGKLKAETPSRRTVVLCTDVTLHRLWVDRGTDLFLATSPAAAASVQRYLPRANVAVIPPPVRPQFYDAPSREDAREMLGLRSGTPCVLVIDSGWGLGALDKSVAGLAGAGVDVLAVAGRRTAVEERFRSLAEADVRVHPFGFVDDVPALMAAADAVVTLAGATTCSEARVVGRPLLLLDLMPGHGRENVLHELEQGSARVCGRGADGVVDAALALLDHLPMVQPSATAPRWEPRFAAALAGIGIDLGGAAVVGAEQDGHSPAPRADRAVASLARRSEMASAQRP